jgi:hypothetical protein
MKTYFPVLTVSFAVASDIPKARFIGFNGALCAQNAKALGVSEVDTKQGQQMPVIVYGIALVESGGAVNVGDAVTSDANGKAVPAETNPVNGYALDAASGAGEIIRIKLV